MTPLQIFRNKKKYALQILLAQVRTAGDRWSDGTVVRNGPELATFKRDILAQMIRLRDGTRAPAMARLTHNLVSSPSYLGPKHYASIRMWLEEMAIRGTRDTSAGGTDRRVTARRLLRRMSPSAFHDFARRNARAARSAQEMGFIARAIERKPWIVRHDLTICTGNATDDILIPAGSKVIRTAPDEIWYETPDLVRIPLRAEWVMRARPRHFRPNGLSGRLCAATKVPDEVPD